MGKRQRSSSMRRTTSMAWFDAAQLHPSEEQLHLTQVQRNQRRSVDSSTVAGNTHSGGQAGASWLDQATPWVRGAGGARSCTGELAVAETAPFLMACGLCKRRLGPGRDTFIYRGDIAFCSLECRQLHINQDELKEKCSLIYMKDAPPTPNGSEDSEGYGTAAAA